MSREGIDRGPPELNLKQVSAGESVAWDSKEIQSRSASGFRPGRQGAYI
jgi:hypothetical protein